MSSLLLSPLFGIGFYLLCHAGAAVIRSAARLAGEHGESPIWSELGLAAPNGAEHPGS